MIAYVRGHFSVLSTVLSTVTVAEKDIDNNRCFYQAEKPTLSREIDEFIRVLSKVFEVLECEQCIRYAVDNIWRFVLCHTTSLADKNTDQITEKIQS